MSRTLLLLSVLFILTAAACTKNPTNSGVSEKPSTQSPLMSSEKVVRVASETVEIPHGGTADAIVHITVQNGYHINANPPTYPYLKATEIELTAAGGISVAFIKYPNSIVKKFPFAEKPVAIYEGDTPLHVQLKAAPTAAKGASNLAGKVKVQACDDQVCYPPGEIAIAIPVTVK
jgi:DsbC/DsbD-like thiol-disulfide interchange protein